MKLEELMRKIAALSPEKQREIERFVSTLEEEAPFNRCIDAAEAKTVSARIFEENAELFKKLAQL